MSRHTRAKAKERPTLNLQHKHAPTWHTLSIVQHETAKGRQVAIQHERWATDGPPTGCLCWRYDPSLAHWQLHCGMPTYCDDVAPTQELPAYYVHLTS
jgi:hypothetical protein